MIAAPSVSVRGLTVRFGAFTAVDDISFSVGKGEIFGFLGANGAGKTTTIRALCGLLAPTAGSIEVAGRSPDSPRELKERIGYMSQRFTLYPDLTVRENLDFAGALRKLGPEKTRARSRELLDFTAFRFDTGKLVRELPAGARQQVALAAAILHDPEVIFLDEPTAGVSASSRLLFWRLIRELSGRGKTIFVTTHYMDEAEECARLALMSAGRIIALDSPARLKEQAFRHPLAQVAGAPGLDLEREIRRSGAGRAEASGLNWRVEISDDAAWQALAHELKLSWHPIPPSLEDVFLKLVGGAR